VKRQFHGVVSLLLVFGSLLAGLAAVLRESAAMGIVYVVIIFISLPAILYSFCSKCPCRLDSCGHVFPGMLARLFPPRKEGRYTPSDIAGVVVPFLFLIGFPQWWLMENKVLLAVFWVPAVIGVLEIRPYVCPGCGNEMCPMCVRSPQ
jgi:hypothetical protein